MIKINNNSSRQVGAASAGLIVMISIIGATLLIAIWLTSGLMGASKWPIRWLDVSGPFQRVSADQIRSALVDEVDGGFFSVNLERVRLIAEEIPWVSRAQARKQWPETIEIRVLEHQAVAHWGKGQLINDEGTAFTVPAAEQIQGLPYLSGPQEQVESVVTLWQQMSKRLQGLSLEVQDLRVYERGAWELKLNTNTTVRLGREDVLPRLQRLVSSWESLTQQGSRIPVSIDLRYTNGFSVLWAES